MIKAALLWGLGFLSVVFFLHACGSSTTTSSGPTSLESLPKATGSVSASSISKIANASKASPTRFDLQTAASTGVLMTAWDDQTWNSTKSAPGCNIGQSIIRLLSEAAQPDKIMCYVGAMEKLGAFTGSYDGTNKFYTLSGAGGGGRPGGGTMLIKFNMTKDSSGVISDFKMWMCQSSGRVTTQSEYVAESISGTTATVTSVGVHSGDFGSGSQRTAVTGAVTSAGVWTSKTITHTGAFSGGSGGSAFSHSQYLTLTQASDSFTLNGYMSGYHGGSSNTDSGRFYAVMQGLNLGTLATAALGSGTGKFEFTHTGSRPTHTATKSWNGDTMAPESSTTASYYTEVNSATLPTAASITAPTFSGTEIWDCSPDAGITSTTLNLEGVSGMPTETAACDAKYGFTNNNHTNCWAASFD